MKSRPTKKKTATTRSKASTKTPKTPKKTSPVSQPKASASSLPAVTLGSRLQRTRVNAGLSIRELADHAGVNKDTIVKLERGHTPSYRTLCRVCDGLGVTVVQLLKPELDDDSASVVSIHTRKSEKGQRSSRKQATETRVRAAGQRELLATDNAVKLSWLACRLVGGQLNSWLLELTGETETTTHPGEEFLFCLKGTCRLTVSGKTYELHEGDAATFWCAEPHSYAPSDQCLTTGQLPVLVLSVWISAVDAPAK